MTSPRDPQPDARLTPPPGSLPGAGAVRSLWSSPWTRVALVALVVVALDQLSKRAVRHSIVPGEERRVLPGIELVDTRNHGVAFGFLPGDHVAVTS